MSVSKTEAAMVLARCSEAERAQLIDEAVAALAADVPRRWDPHGPLARTIELAAEFAERGDKWCVTAAVGRRGGNQGAINALIAGRFGTTYNLATLAERADMLRELAAKGPA